jgi:tetratricopeptide (TPR) repeat protein
LQQRLAVERSHLAELAALLEGEQAVGELGALVQTSDALARCPITADVHRRLLHTQYALGVALGDAGRQAEALNRLAAPLIAGSRYAAAQPLLEQVLHLAGRDTMPWDTLADTYGRLSHCYIQLGQADAAGNMLQASLELARQLGNGMRLVEALSGMLHLWKLRGESLAQGQQMLTQNIAELTERNQPMAVARLRGLLAEVHLERGETTDAARLLQEALATLRTERDGEGLYHILLGLAQVSLAKEDAAQAAHYYAEAQACRPPHQDDLYESDVLAQLCALQERRGLYDDAVASYERLQERYERRGDREGLIAVLDAVGGLYYQLGRQEESILCYQRRLQLLEHGDPAPATHRSA